MTFGVDVAEGRDDYSSGGVFVDVPRDHQSRDPRTGIGRDLVKNRV
jgi:hypothetical protein